MSEAGPMITLEGVSKRFGGAQGFVDVFQDVNLRIARSESLVLIGPSGSGKSVLLKIIAGLLQPDSGRVTVGTTNVGMLFQKNALFDSFTVEENLLFPLRERLNLRGTEAHQRAMRFLEAVGLAHAAGLMPSEISGGMQKRLGIARALAVRPEVILYDEPTAGLDPITSRSIAELIQALRREEESTLVTVTNDMQRAYQLGDRIALLAQGHLTLGGSPAEVRATRDPALHQFILGLREGPLTSGLA